MTATMTGPPQPQHNDAEVAAPRRNLIFTLMCIEIMLNASGLAFVAAGSRWGQPDGQVMFLFILAMAAAEVSVGLAFVLLFHRRQAALDVDAASELRG